MDVEPKALLDSTGSVLPLSRHRPEQRWGLELVSLGSAWLNENQPLFDQDVFHESGRDYRFLASQPLDRSYVQWLETAWGKPEH